jgi:hypothetical protein
MLVIAFMLMRGLIHCSFDSISIRAVFSVPGAHDQLTRLRSLNRVFAILRTVPLQSVRILSNHTGYSRLICCVTLGVWHADHFPRKALPPPDQLTTGIYFIRRLVDEPWKHNNHLCTFFYPLIVLFVLLSSFHVLSSYLLMSSSTPSKRLLIFCDGTWCGRETGTSSNIRILADMVGQVQFPSPTATPSQSDSTTTVFPLITSQSNVIAGYQEGVGLNKTFLEYLWDGATASTIGEECTSAYKFIVDNYDDDTEIYMFGFSRGAYTVRCVAGMINNCGIIRRPSDLSNADIQTLCREVYRTYRSPLDIDHPKSDKRKKLKEDGSKVWQAKRPVRLMCISDTVGALGVPRLNAGVGFDWPEFYDQQVSTVVQEM